MCVLLQGFFFFYYCLTHCFLTLILNVGGGVPPVLVCSSPASFSFGNSFKSVLKLKQAGLKHCKNVKKNMHGEKMFGGGGYVVQGDINCCT